MNDLSITVSTGLIYDFTRFYNAEKHKIKATEFGLINYFNFIKFLKKCETISTEVQKKYMDITIEHKNIFINKHPDKKLLIEEFLKISHDFVKANQFINEHEELSLCIEDLKILTDGLNSEGTKLNEVKHSFKIKFSVLKFIEVLEKAKVDNEFIQASMFLIETVINEKDSAIN